MKYALILCCTVSFVSTALVISTAVATTRFRPTEQLITAAHRVLDMGYDCRASGAERVACHAQLTTAISQRFR